MGSYKPRNETEPIGAHADLKLFGFSYLLY